MKKGVIFDMDGLLFDTEVLYNEEWYRSAQKYHLTIHADMLDELRGTSGTIMYQIIHRYLPEVDAEHLMYEIFTNAQNRLSQGVPMKKGAKELLAYLYENKVKMAVASSAPLELIQNNLRQSSTDFYFDAVVSGEACAHGKPAPDIFLLAAEQLALKPQDCYVLEDGIHGAYAGIRAGCSTIMVPDLVMPTKELYMLCDGIYKDLVSFTEMLKTEAARTKIQ